MVGRRSAEVLAAIAAGKLAPRELPPPRDSPLYTETRLVAAAMATAAAGTAAAAAQSVTATAGAELQLQAPPQQ